MAAINRIGFGNVNKIVCVFPSVFWPNVSFFGVAPNTTGATRGLLRLFTNYNKVNGAPVLVTYALGDDATAFESLSQAQVEALVLQRLQELFPSTFVAPSRVVFTRWGSDPFARGTYSYAKLGMVSTNDIDTDWATYAAPVNQRVFFAGEATTRQYRATVHGAYLSGLEAARLVAALPTPAPTPAPTTRAPSAAPSARPTSAPTPGTVAPSGAPSVQTTAPTTGTPSAAASATPSAAPTTVPPTVLPSRAPTTASPSLLPSAPPTRTPTRAPTTAAAPSVAPTTPGTATPTPAAQCGNGVVELGESCDFVTARNGCVGCQVAPGYVCTPATCLGKAPAACPAHRRAFIQAHTSIIMVYCSRGSAAVPACRLRHGLCRPGACQQRRGYHLRRVSSGARVRGAAHDC